MKLVKRLAVSDEIYDIVSDDTYIELFSPGRASFTIESSEPVSGLVTLDVGYSRDAKLQRWFTGYVETSTRKSKHQQQVFCRELSASLNQIMPLSLRHVTLKDVVQKISEETGIVFSIPDSKYSNTKVPFFYSVSGGYHNLDAMEAVFQIPRFIWQQQGDGSIFVGSWDDSFFANRSITLPEDYFTGFNSDQGAKINVIPKLRPGMFFNESSYIQSVRIHGSEMRITWSDRLKR